MTKSKLQSAMEYLMTYGWAILIIAVILGALFGLGFFNSANLAVKASPGSCQVYRPNGPGTTAFIDLEGTCDNELPQYTAALNPAGSGSLSYYVNVPGYQPLSSPQFSYFAWMDPTSSGGGQNFRRVVATGGGDTGAIEVAVGNSGISEDIMINGYSTGGWVSLTGGSNTIFSMNTWNFVGATYNGVAYTVYFNGEPMWSKIASLSGATTGSFQIGYATSNPPSGDQFFGYIADVQAYNASLSSNEVAALYDEGIGGDPITINNLAGWWPLNGNTDDYSGNLDNGVPTNVVFTSSWTAGYVAP